MKLARIVLNIYSICTWLLHYVVIFYLKYRVSKGKEDQERYQEKLCIYDIQISRKTIQAKNGKEIIWIHAASAGEFNSIKSLLKKIDSPSRFLLITTTTRSGATLFEKYCHISKNIHHVFMPIDAPQAVNAFLDFWQPKSLILVESEIFPNLIRIASKKLRVCLINARMSQKSFDRWSIYPSILKSILSHFCFISAGTNTDFRRYQYFNSNVFMTGNLKYDVEQLTGNPTDIRLMQQSVNKRNILTCISTHPGEEELLVGVYKALKEKIPNLLMIIAPRHIERAKEIHNLCFNNALTSILRANKEYTTSHIPNDAQIYILNTLDELGLVLSVSKIVFIGGSFVNIGGHNVCEPAKFSCAMITGKHFQNFMDIVNDMQRCNGLIIVNDKEALTNTVLDLINNPAKVKLIGENAKKFVDSQKGVLDKTLELLKSHDIIS